MSEPLFENIWNIPASAGRVVGIANYRDQFIIACEYSVFRCWFDEVRGTFKAREIPFQSDAAGESHG